MAADVTILVVNHNQSRFVADALASACGQTGAQVVVEVHDDGSTPQDVVALRHVLAGYPQVTLTADGENVGLSARLNRALQGVVTPWVMVLAADDTLEPTAVADLLGGASSDVAVVWGNVQVMDEAGNPCGMVRPRQGWQGRIAAKYRVPGGPYLDLLRFNNFVTGGCSLIRVAAIREVGGWDANVTTEDYDLWLRLSQRHTLQFVDVVTGHYRQVAGSKSRRHAHKLHDNIAILAKHAGQSPDTDAAIGRTVWLRWLYTAMRSRRLPAVSLVAMAHSVGIPVSVLGWVAPGLAWSVVWRSVDASLRRAARGLRRRGRAAAGR